MPDITIIKLKIRRGSNAQRTQVVLEQGELGYVTDTKRVFVGDGATYGGNVVGNIAHTPLLVTDSRLGLATAMVGDIVNEKGLLYQLTNTAYSLSSSWTFIGATVDNSLIEYNASNALTLKNNSITGSKFASTAAYVSGGLIATSSFGVSANVDSSTLIITPTNKIAIGSITTSNIPTSVLGNGIEGGNGSVVQINEDPALFGYNGSYQLTLTALPAGIVNTAALSSASIGAGLSISSNQLVATVQSVDNSTLKLVAGVAQLKDFITANTTAFENITYNTYGQITGKSSVVYENLSGKNTGTTAIFNGHIEQDVFSNQTLLTVMSANNPSLPTAWATVTLSSAGFMSLATSMGRVAIPIFNY